MVAVSNAYISPLIMPFANQICVLSFPPNVEDRKSVKDLLMQYRFTNEIQKAILIPRSGAFYMASIIE